MKLLSIIFATCICGGCLCQSIDNTDTLITVEYRVELLKSTFKNLDYTKTDTVSELEFFNTFPNSFNSFNEIFGYTVKGPHGIEFNPAPLYTESLSYIEAFYNLNLIDRSLLFERIINISINGIWYGDGVNHFQYRMKSVCNNNLFQFCVILAERKKSDIKSFWAFYFDNPVPMKEIPTALQKLGQIDKEMFAIMEKEYSEALESSVKH